MALTLDRTAILGWLRETDAARLEELWRSADRMRREHVGDEVHLRGLVEISNHCLRYPAKACVRETADGYHQNIAKSVQRLGRQIGQGPGASPNLRRRERGVRPAPAPRRATR
jgi:hypothetical protein